MEKIVVTNGNKSRLDKYIFSVANIDTRSQVKKMFDENKVFVNGGIKKAGYIVCDGDIVTFELPSKPSINIEAQEMPLEIIYEDDDIICVNKPQGLVVHPGASNYDKTLVNGLKFHTDELSDLSGETRLGIVHRIDKNTSGLLLVAKNNMAHLELQRQIQTKECKRFYIALLYGKLKEKSGIIDKNLRRSMKDRTKIEVCAKGDGRTAVTLYEVIAEYNGYSLVKFELKTGRTHQIRVHAKSMGHAVVGDDVYSGVKDKFNTNGQLLHAYEIHFSHPRTKQKMSFTAPIPKYFQDIITKLERQ